MRVVANLGGATPGTAIHGTTSGGAIRGRATHGAATPLQGTIRCGMCGVGNALKHGSLSNSPKERRSPCRRESRSCSRLGCQVFLLTALKKLVVLTITRPNVNLSNRSNSQVQGLVTRELSVGPEGLRGRCGPFEDAVGFQIGYWIHVEYG